MLEDSIGYICPDKLSKEEIPEISNGLKKNQRVDYRFTLLSFTRFRGFYF